MSAEPATIENTMTPERRALSLMRAFGWQGGTIHQVARVTGCKAHDLLHAKPSTLVGLICSESMGFSAARTCSTEWLLNTLAPKHQGDVEFWLGVAWGQYLHDNGAPSFAKT